MNVLPANANRYLWSKSDSRDRRYELKSAGELCGTLYFMGGTGSLARAETAHGMWTLKRQGFLSPRVTVRGAGLEETVGLFTPSWSGGGQFLYRDTRYEVSASGWFHPTWTVHRDGKRVLHTESKGSETLVYLDGTWQPEPDILALLLVPALYVPILAAEDAATAAVTAAIVG